MLVQAAAQQWDVEPRELHDGERPGDRTRQAAASSAMARSRGAASKRRPRPTNVPLKDPKDFKLIGKPLKRLDTPDKVNGKAVYGIDAHAARHEVRDPRRQLRCSAARSAGRRQRREEDCPACARSSCSTISSPWSAITCGPPRRASRRSTITWDDGANATISSSEIWQDLRAASDEGRRRRQIRRRCRQGARQAGETLEAHLRAAVPRARADGADELHRACARRTAARSGSAPRS